MSTGLQNFVYNADVDSEEEKENEEVLTQQNLLQVLGMYMLFTNNLHTHYDNNE